MLNAKIYKQDFDSGLYERCANWCNANGATIVDRGEYYECVAIPAPALKTVKENKIAELKEIRNAKEMDPIMYGGYSFDFDRDAIMRIQLAAQTMQDGEIITWTDADNHRINGVNADDLKAILRAGKDRSDELHIRYNQLKNQVERATDVDQVNAIAWRE